MLHQLTHEILNLQSRLWKLDVHTKPRPPRGPAGECGVPNRCPVSNSESVGASNIGTGGNPMRQQDKARLVTTTVLLLVLICWMGPRTACAKPSQPVYIPVYHGPPGTGF